MSLYATPPFADKTEDERRIRHAQLMYLMGIGDGGLPSGPAIDPRLSFWAPLLTTLVPTKAGNPTFTFQRATSPAYVRDHEGILRQAIADEARFQGARRVRNFLAFSQNFASAPWAPNNASITPGVLGPTGANDATTLTATAASGQIAANTGGPGGSWVNSFWIKRRTGIGSVQLFLPNAATVDITAQLTSAWQRFSTAPFAAGTPGWAGVFLAISGDAVDIAYAQKEDVSGQSNQAPSEYVSVGVLAAPYHGNAIDGVKYFASTNGNSVTGNVVTEATGSLIPAATLLGYLAENAATNLCLQSQTFDNVSWSKINVTVTSNTQIAPDGTLTADTQTDDATNAVHHVQQSNPAITAGTWTYSIYAKQGTLPWLQLLVYDGASRFANFNLATGAIGNSGSIVSSSTTTLPNGWFRFSITVTLTAVGTVYCYCSQTNSAGASPTYVGTGQTMYLWGAQVETGADPSSYVPTTTVAVVRVQDVLSYAAASNVDGALGTSYAETYWPTPWVGALDTIVNLASPFYPLYIDPAAKKLGFTQSGTGILTANARTVGAVNKNASAWSNVDATRSLCLNGGVVATGTFVTNAPSIISIGQSSFTAAVALKGSIRNVKFYNVRIADADLVTMTGP